MTQPTASELADELEALAKSADTGSWDDRAKANALLRNTLIVNLPAILSALRQVELMKGALVSIDEYWNGDSNHDAMLDACEHNRETARQALTGEAQ